MMQFAARIELYTFPILVIGALVVLFALLWAFIRAWNTSFGWGISCTLFPPLLLVFLWKKQGFAPAVLLLAGILAIVTPVAANRAVNYFIDLGPLETWVDDERHLTLTGWDRKDYSFLTFQEDIVKLQMANSDVTDETVVYLHNLRNLRELDLNHTKITDVGLERIVNGSPKLTGIFLRGTAITDAGFRKSLMPMKNLKNVDLRETAVEPATYRLWKAADPDRRGFAPGPKAATPAEKKV